MMGLTWIRWLWQPPILSAARPYGEIKALTSMRGLAAMAVVLTHFSATAQSYCSGWIPSLVPHGYMAVDFFFVLSGFIMCYTYLAEFREKGMRAYGPFLLKRVARIVPLCLATVAAILVLAGVASLWGRLDLFIQPDVMDPGLPTAILVNVLQLQGFLGHNLNGPSWSISVELGAYLLFPILIAILFLGARWVVALVILAGTATLTAAAYGQPRLEIAGDYPLFGLVRCVIEFGYGMLAYRVFMAPGRLRALGRDVWTWSATALSVALLFLRLDLLVAFSFPLLVLAWALNDGAASRLLSARIPYFLGVVSFSIYLVHGILRRPELALVEVLFPDKLPPVAALAFALLGSLSAIPLATLSYYKVERPGRDMVNGFARNVRKHRDTLARRLGTARQ